MTETERMEIIKRFQGIEKVQTAHTVVLGLILGIVVGLAFR